MVHATDQILAALAGRAPTSTGELADAIGQPRNEPITWRALNWLARQGLIARVELPDARSVYWCRVDAVSAADLEQLLNDLEEVDGDDLDWEDDEGDDLDLEVDGDE
jgi:hypothetical protein